MANHYGVCPYRDESKTVRKRFTPSEVIDLVDQWVTQPNVRLLGPGDHHWSFLRQTILEGSKLGAR